MTNCEEYRQMIAADPAFDGGAEHLSECRQCQAFRADMQALNADIAKALEIPCPALEMPGLPSIDVDNVSAMNRPRSWSKPAWLAIAASVMFAALIGLRLLDVGVSYDSLANEILAHVDHEPAALLVSDQAVSDARLRRAVPANIATMNHDAGLITYAQSCIINGHTVPHLVIQGERGPVTILLMPEERVAKAVELNGVSVRGVILPVGAGSVAIIGARDEELGRIEKNVLNSVMWSS